MSLQKAEPIMEPVSEIPSEARRADVPTVFNAFRDQMEKLRETALTITVTDVKDKAGMKLAKETRLQLRQVRIATEKRRVELKEAALDECQRIDRAAKEVKDAIEVLETRLEEQEKFIERETLRIEAEVREKRAAEIAPFLTFAIAADYGKMTEEEYLAMLNGARAEYERKAQEARLAEEQRLKAEAEARAEQERIRQENERLKKEAEAREEELAAERARVAAERAREQAEAEKKAREEREAMEAERLRIQAETDARLKAEQEKARVAQEAAEAAEAERLRVQAEAEARLKAEQERARLAAEAAAREQARLKAEADALRAENERQAAIELAARRKLEAEEAQRKAAAETEKKRLEEEARRAAMAPVADKLRAFVKQINGLQIPDGIPSETLRMVANYRQQFAVFVAQCANDLAPEDVGY